MILNLFSYMILQNLLLLILVFLSLTMSLPCHRLDCSAPSHLSMWFCPLYTRCNIIWRPLHSSQTLSSMCSCISTFIITEYKIYTLTLLQNASTCFSKSLNKYILQTLARTLPDSQVPIILLRYSRPLPYWCSSVEHRTTDSA